MAQMPQLLQGVLDNPDADEPRLAYAQWCDQQDDQPTKDRGEFIRAQIELVGAHGDIRKTVPLDYKITKLSEQHSQTWGQPLAMLVDSFEFDRGFIELVAMPASAFLERAGQLYQLAPIRHLDLTGVEPIAQKLFESSSLGVIRSLGISRCDLGDMAMSYLAACAHLEGLRWLDLAENRVGLDGAISLASSEHLNQLAYVVFNRNKIDLDEVHAHDGGYIVDSSQPEASLRLEANFGYQPWLHHEPKTIANTIPDRFRIEAAAPSEPVEDVTE